jgi:hypothetical protein
VPQVRAGPEGGEGGRVLAELLLQVEPHQAVLRPERLGKTGSVKVNGKQAKSCFGRVFLFKLGCFCHEGNCVALTKCPHQELKSWRSFGLVSLSLSEVSHLGANAMKLFSSLNYECS